MNPDPSAGLEFSGKPIQIADGIWWVGHYMEDDPFQCHAYLIEHGDQSVLIDPGSKLTFRHTLKKIEEVTALNNIRYFICHHQDPDITGALPLIAQLTSRPDAVVVSHWRAITLLKHYGFDLDFWCVEEHGWKLDLGSRELEFIFTPYLHFPGAFCTFDHRTGTLFSSDLFGGFTKGWSLFARDESYFEAIRPFHEHYMPSRDILFQGMTKLENYPLKMIAPQHGSIIPEGLIPFMISQLKNLDCGLFLMTQTSTEITRLARLNEILHRFLASMAFYKTFREIASECLVQMQRVIPAQALAFYALAVDRSFIRLESRNLFRSETVEIPERFKNLIGLSLGHWEERFAGYLCQGPADWPYPSGTNRKVQELAIPLLDPENQTIGAIALFALSAPVEIDQETTGLIRQLSVPLSVAVERELITRSLELERQKFYEQSIRDPLTNLYTRVYMREAVQRLFSIHDREPSAAVGILALDIDHFKSVNDSHGHSAGDEAIKTVADIIVKETRGGDIQVRLGGEEYAVFVVLNDPSILETIAERIRKRVEATRFPLPESDFKVTISIGAIMRRSQESIPDAIHRADLALYEAKNTGRNKICARF